MESIMSDTNSKERDNRITIRVSDAELKILKDATEKDDRTLTSFVRMYAIKFAKENFGAMRDLLEEEKMIAKREEVLKRRMDIEYEELKYASGAYDPVNRM